MESELEVLKRMSLAEVVALTTDVNGFTVVLANGRVFRSTTGTQWEEDPPVPGTMANSVLRRDDPLEVEYRRAQNCLQAAARAFVDNGETEDWERDLATAAREYHAALHAKRGAEGW